MVAGSAPGRPVGCPHLQCRDTSAGRSRRAGLAGVAQHTHSGQGASGHLLLGHAAPGGQRADCRCEITAILVLCGLPWLLAGSILAHEVMHAWLRLAGFPALPPPTEEGLCQLMALLWLEQQPAEPEVCCAGRPVVCLLHSSCCLLCSLSKRGRACLWQAGDDLVAGSATERAAGYLGAAADPP